MSEILREPLVVKNAGKGYLGMPNAFKKRFAFNAKTLPEPVASLEEVDGHIRLVYSWKKGELKQNA